MGADPVLRPELVPRPLHRKSFHERLRESQWRRLRAEVLAEAHNTCQYCGDSYDSRMVCHERWHYNDASAIVTLVGFACTCQTCNFALHFGRAGRPDIDRKEEGIAQMMRVNGMTRREVEQLRGDSYREWVARSGKPWRMEVAPDILARFPVLAEAPTT